MKTLSYCPSCGSSSLSFDNNIVFNCPCGFQLYHNTAGAVAVLLKYEDKILFTKRNKDPRKGFLDLPGGFVDPNESAEETCQRELFEELNIELNPANFKYIGSLPNIYTYKEIDYNTLDLFYEYTLTELPKIRLEKSEISDVVWMSPLELNIDEIAFDSQKKFLKKHLVENG